MALRFKRKLLLAAIEDTYGTDQVPTAGANAIETMDLQISPLEGETENRDIDRPALGNDLTFHTSVMRRLTFKCSLAASGTVDVAPAIDPLLRMCGRAVDTTEAGKVRYLRASSGYESGTLYANFDGNLYRLLGARGTFVENYPSKRLPFADFTIDGLWVPVTAQPIVNGDLSAFKKPIPVNFANTSGVALLGNAIRPRSIQLTEGNDVQHFDMPGEDSIDIVDRAPSGSVTFDEQLADVVNWDQLIRDNTTGTFAFQHGQTAGSIIRREFARVQPTQPSLGEDQSRSTRQVNLNPLPTATGGDDEDIISFE